MTQQIINIGDAPNDGTGDQLRVSFDKCNLNFTELYDRSSSVSGFAEYRFDTVTTPPPASGYIRTNNASIAAITVLYFHNVTNNGSDIKRVLTELPVGATLVIQDQVNNVNFGKFNITATPIDHGTYVEFPVTVADSGGTFFNNTKLLVAMSGGGGGGGGLAVGSTPITGGANGNFLYDNAAIIGERTPTQTTAILDLFTSTLKGLAPGSGGGTANFLRADGTWAAPATVAMALPTQQVFTSGSGSYAPPAGCRCIEVTMVGGGAGGGGGAAGGAGTGGGNSIFGTLTANGAAANLNGYQSGVSGSASGGNVNFAGGRGNSGSASNNAVGTNGSGGMGGNSIFGGAGSGDYIANGSNAAANTGAGGGGGVAGTNTSSAAGTGGSAGGACLAMISSPAASYSYTVGAGGTGGTAGGPGSGTGGNGAAGIIIVKEFY